MRNLYKFTAYTARAQRIFVQQQTLDILYAGSFTDLGECFLRSILWIRVQKMVDCLKTLAF
jgi:hypothetical protein